MERSMFVDEVQAELDRERYSNQTVKWASVGCLLLCLISAAIMGYGLYALIQVL